LPASIGALLAQSQLGGSNKTRKDAEQPRTYGGELFIMAIGALFLAFNIAPTEEMILIAYKMTSWQALALAALSVTTMHAFVYSLEFRGQVGVPSGRTFLDVFMRFTIAGYGLALLMSAYMLWTFGRFDGNAAPDMVTATIVLAFPAAVGAAAARLIL
jgi:putative integral membrane protein (TIGR02587 family)